MVNVLASLIRSQMQAGAVDLVHLPGRSVLEPFQLTVCKGERSSCWSCTVLTSVVCEGELGASFPPRGSCGFSTHAGDFCPQALSLPLWLTHGSFGSCGYSTHPPPRDYLAPTGDILIVTSGGGHCHPRGREQACCSGVDAEWPRDQDSKSEASSARSDNVML